MDTNKDNSEEIKYYEPRLNQEWVQILINLRMKYSKLFTRKRNSAAEAWKNILQEMIELGAPPYVTLDKIKKKWMNLIARYKHLKFTSNAETITWPYFEHIDRAYSRNPSIVELRKSNSRRSSESDDSYVSDYAEFMMQKQKFTSILIQLRYNYRHLFTGKKYAAQKGWMMIQNLLPNGRNYTIEQISKCWQNLIQRYKSLIENEKDHGKISWVHFKSMHEIMSKKDDNAQSTQTTTTSSTQQSSQQPITSTIIKREASPALSVHTLEMEDAAPELPETQKRRKRATNINDLLEYLKARDRRLDVQHAEIVAALNRIGDKLN